MLKHVLSFERHDMQLIRQRRGAERSGDERRDAAALEARRGPPGFRGFGDLELLGVKDFRGLGF